MNELPGHEFLLHVLFSVESPGQTEDFFERDIFRDGTSHARFLICSPPPQVFVHVDHSPQLDHSEKKVISYFFRGSFKNYVDQFLSYFHHLPTYRGLSWTFGALPSLCPRGHRTN